jgi:hypothetical protein
LYQPDLSRVAAHRAGLSLDSLAEWLVTTPSGCLQPYFLLRDYESQNNLTSMTVPLNSVCSCVESLHSSCSNIRSNLDTEIVCKDPRICSSRNSSGSLWFQRSEIDTGAKDISGERFALDQILDAVSAPTTNTSNRPSAIDQVKVYRYM